MQTLRKFIQANTPVDPLKQLEEQVDKAFADLLEATDEKNKPNKLGNSADDNDDDYADDPEGDIPDHFFSAGENVEVFGYQTKNFDICEQASKTANDIMMADPQDTQSVVQGMQALDDFFGVEKTIVENQVIDNQDTLDAFSSLSKAMFYLGRGTSTVPATIFSDMNDYLQEHMQTVLDRYVPDEIEDDDDDEDEAAQFKKNQIDTSPTIKSERR